MSAFGIKRELLDAPNHWLSDKASFFFVFNQVKESLDGVCSFLRAADLQEISLNRFQNLDPEFRVAGLRKFLAEIVAIVISHQFADILEYLVQEELYDVDFIALDSFLDIPL